MRRVISSCALLLLAGFLYAQGGVALPVGTVFSENKLSADLYQKTVNLSEKEKWTFNEVTVNKIKSFTLLPGRIDVEVDLLAWRC